jgi:flagellin
MSSLLTNTSAMNALATLRMINKSTQVNQDRITTGLKVQSSKDNAAYFSISKSLGSDSAMYKAIDEGMTLTKNSVATARAGAEEVAALAGKFAERMAFAQSPAVDLAAVENELNEIVQQIGVVIQMSTFNGNDLVSTPPVSQTVVTGIQRAAAGGITPTTVTFNSVDLTAILTNLTALASVTGSAGLAADLTSTEVELKAAIDAATDLGIAENTIESQQAFSKSLTDVLDKGVGAMIDADMEKEAARNSALQVQGQMAIQSLSIANQNPQMLLQLFR